MSASDPVAITMSAARCIEPLTSDGAEAGPAPVSSNYVDTDVPGPRSVPTIVIVGNHEVSPDERRPTSSDDPLRIAR